MFLAGDVNNEHVLKAVANAVVVVAAAAVEGMTTSCLISQSGMQFITVNVCEFSCCPAALLLLLEKPADHGSILIGVAGQEAFCRDGGRDFELLFVRDGGREFALAACTIGEAAAAAAAGTGAPFK